MPKLFFVKKGIPESKQQIPGMARYTAVAALSLKLFSTTQGELFSQAEKDIFRENLLLRKAVSMTLDRGG